MTKPSRKYNTTPPGEIISIRETARHWIVSSSGGWVIRIDSLPDGMTADDDQNIYECAQMILNLRRAWKTSPHGRVLKYK